MCNAQLEDSKVMRKKKNHVHQLCCGYFTFTNLYNMLIKWQVNKLLTVSKIQATGNLLSSFDVQLKKNTFQKNSLVKNKYCVIQQCKKQNTTT